MSAEKSSGSQSLNTAECILESSLQLYESEFQRAYKIMRKVQKGKLQINDLFAPYESFLTFSTDGSAAIKPDSGYQFAIVLTVMTTTSQVSNSTQNNLYYHQKFLMTVESKLRSLLVHLDTILNPAKASTPRKEFQFLIRPIPKPQTTVIQDAQPLILCSELYIGIKQIITEREMGVIDVSPAIERFADKVKGLIPPC